MWVVKILNRIESNNPKSYKIRKYVPRLLHGSGGYFLQHLVISDASTCINIVREIFTSSPTLRGSEPTSNYNLRINLLLSRFIRIFSISFLRFLRNSRLINRLSYDRRIENFLKQFIRYKYSLFSQFLDSFDSSSFDFSSLDSLSMNIVSFESLYSHKICLNSL
jgi:hypothetical protein